jgi:environmental stress-induced protein Ves
MPWKNGGGSTREILREDGALPDDPPVVRVSIAEVASDGPFSQFPHVDRVILLLEGAGMTLAFPDRRVTLATPGVPFSFAGETPCQCTLLAPGSPIRDLNVMVDRRRAASSVRLLRDDHFAPPSADHRHLLVALGDLSLLTPDAASTPLRLVTGDVALPPEGGLLQGPALLVTLSPPVPGTDDTLVADPRVPHPAPHG